MIVSVPRHKQDFLGISSLTLLFFSVNNPDDYSGMIKVILERK